MILPCQKRLFDMGERSNFINLPMAVAPLTQIRLGRREHRADPDADRRLCGRDRRIARAQGAARAAPRPAHERTPLRGWFRTPVPQALAAEGIHVSVRGGALRVSPHLYNTTADLERLGTALRRHL